MQEAVDNDSGSGDLSKLVLNVPPGEGLYVILEGWGPSECGVVNLVVTAEPPPSPPPPSLPVRCVVLCLKIIFYTLSNTALYRLALCTYFTRDQTLLSRGLLSVHIFHVIKHCSLEACSLYNAAHDAHGCRKRLPPPLLRLLVLQIGQSLQCKDVVASALSTITLMVKQRRTYIPPEVLEYAGTIFKTCRHTLLNV